MDIKEQEKMEALRKRLYERGQSDVVPVHHDLTDEPVENIPTHFSDIEVAESEIPAEETTTEPESEVLIAEELPEQTMSPRRKKRGYRLKILLAGVGFFVFAMVVSSLFLLFGNNSISGENITIVVTGPFAVGGGEVLPLQVGITNGNAVAIESATLIVSYPSGTKSADEGGGDLYTERLALETIDTGETVNIPLRAIVFGEENEEKNIEVSIEYRVEGSNATFFKEAEPLRFKISSSPVTIRADTLKKISSGQETEVVLTITSNSPSTLSEVLVKAEYPIGFDYTTAEPAPTASQNMWLIKNLEPESSQTIKITGVVIGKETDEYAINFTVGVPNERDQQSLASVFAIAQTAFEIEQPFLDVVLEVNQSTASEIAVEKDDRPRASIEVTNTLEDTIYDVVVTVVLSGNAFSILNVNPSSGFFDPTKNTITWDVSNTRELESITPGDTAVLSFTADLASDIDRTPQLNIDVDASARRVSESDVSEKLFGTTQSVVKVVSAPEIRGDAGHNNGIFTDYGPIPPEVDEETTYSLSLRIENGSNDITDAVVTTTLPPYVDWLDETAGAGTFSYNETSRVIEWNAGNIDANAATFASFQVKLLPRITQTGTTPVLMGEQRIRATDRFTGTVVRDVNPPVSTKLSSESGFGSTDGVVQQ